MRLHVGPWCRGPNCRSQLGMIALVLMLPLLALAVGPVANAGNDMPRAYPALLEMAKERPNEKVRVIVQRKALEKLPEQALAQLGGTKGNDLPMINGFAAELPARAVAALARTPGVRWISIDAPLRSMTAGSTEITDSFSSVSYGGNNGEASWAASWAETGETTSPSSGLVTVVSSSACAGGSGYCLRVDPYYPIGLSVYRQVNLTGAASATLSFYRNNLLTTAYGGQVRVEVSSNGGASWSALRTYSGSMYPGAGTDTFDISGYATSTTQIRFVVTAVQSAYYYAYFDNITVSYAKASPYRTVVGADRVQTTNGRTGSGIGVAVVDSGINQHADFGSRLVASTYFGPFNNANDQTGHGTHVAGIVSGDGPSNKGVAPGANLINVRISDSQGMGTTSDLVNALQWVYNNRTAHNIRVVNLSVISAVPESYHTSPLSAAVELLWFNGVVVVVAAGNNGSGTSPVTIYPPANDPFVITVGATEDKATTSLTDDTVATFSAYGTTSDGYAKPDLVAPGRNLVSTLASTSAQAYANHMAHRTQGNYFRMSGTSMAAPIVAGAVALLLQDEPNLTPDQVKYRLKATANRSWTNYSSTKAGSGQLDAYAAVNGTSTQSSNTGISVSQSLWTGTSQTTWDSVNWNSVNWNSVNWNSVNWNSVNWNSVNWNASLWDD